MARDKSNINFITTSVIPINVQKRYEYDLNNNCIYEGWADRNKSEGDTSAWTLIFYTYDGNSNCTKEQVAFDSWTNRATAQYK